MSKPSTVLARTLANLTRDGRNRRRPSRVARDLTFQTLVADLVAARTAAGMTQQEVAALMMTTKSAVSRLESGRFARPTLNTIERYALARGRSRRYQSSHNAMGAKSFGPVL